MEVVAVKRAVKKSVVSPDAAENGSIKKNVPTMIAKKKLAGMICTGENLISFNLNSFI
jgi:hypothetical protein